MVLADSDGIPRVPPYSGALLCQLSVLHTGLSPSLVLLSNRVLLQIVIHVLESPTTPLCMHTGLGSSRFARRYSGNRFFFLFLQVLRCFSSLGLPSRRYVFTSRYYAIKRSGFPHSEISGSKLTYSSPKHIGVSAVLLRLLVPRHSPCALNNLTKLLSL